MLSLNLTSKINNIEKYCKCKNATKVDYVKLATGGNNPTITRAMRYSQLVQK
jgi:hypothetical protein